MALQDLKAIPGRHTQRIHACRGVEHVELSPHHVPEALGNRSSDVRVRAVEDVSGDRIAEGANHVCDDQYSTPRVL